MKFFLVIFEIFGILFIDYSESRVIKRSEQIYNDDSTSVGQQVDPATVINNPPGGNYYVIFLHAVIKCTEAHS